MTKADIVSEIAKSTGAEKVQVQAIVEAFMESIKGSLAQNNRSEEHTSELQSQR